MGKNAQDKYLDSLNTRIEKAPNSEEKTRLEKLKEWFMQYFKP